MSETFIGVRGVDEETFRKFRARAVEEKTKLGRALTKAMKADLKEKRMRNKKKVNMAKELLKVKPFKVGKKVRWSEEVDEFLYGLKK
jgi:hypothetical protein